MVTADMTRVLKELPLKRAHSLDGWIFEFLRCVAGDERLASALIHVCNLILQGGPHTEDILAPLSDCVLVPLIKGVDDVRPIAISLVS
jgi:hypothetical protein